MNAVRSVDALGAVTVDQFLQYLRRHRKQWPASRIAHHAKLPRSVVYRALKGECVTFKTFSKIVRVMGGEVLIVIKEGQNRLGY